MDELSEFMKFRDTLRQSMKDMLPSMSEEALERCYQFGKSVAADVAQEMKRRGLKLPVKIEVE